MNISAVSYADNNTPEQRKFQAAKRLLDHIEDYQMSEFDRLLREGQIKQDLTDKIWFRNTYEVKK